MKPKPERSHINQAHLTVRSSVDVQGPISIFSQSAECEKCPLHPIDCTLVYPNNCSFYVDTRFPTIVSLQWNDGKPVCGEQNLNTQFAENYNYTLDVQNETGTLKCVYDSTATGIDPFLPILWAALGYLGLALIWLFAKTLYRYNFFRSSDAEQLIITDLGSPDDPNLVFHLSASESSSSIPSTARRRLRSLDTFRGLCLALMIFVNYGGGQYWFFAHSTWNGVTFADLVFPWFMWIMGLSVALSIHSLLRRATPKSTIFLKILKRSVILFILGLVVNTIRGFEYPTLRIMGVLQRFAVTYFLVATLELSFARMNDTHLVTWWASIRDILVYWPQWILMLMLVAVHTLITFFLPVPGCPTGYLGPGGLHMDKEYFNCTRGAAGYIDQRILGLSHIYKKPSCKEIYETKVPYDPEGLLGILTSTFLVFLGLQAGKVLIFHLDNKARLQRWLIWGLILGIIGSILCEGSKNAGFIPVNKNIWSLSFVFVLGSMAFILLCILYILVDVEQWWSGAPFFQPGMNSILLYVGHEVFKGMFPWGWNAKETCTTHSCFLGESLWGTSLWVLIAIALYKKKWFVAI